MATILRLRVNQEPGPSCPSDGELRIGRASWNELCLDRSGISRRHARIFGARGGFLVEDLGSSNGTSLNGRVLKGLSPLRHGDRLRLGDSELEVELPGASSASHKRFRPRRLFAWAAALVIPVATAHLLAGGAAQAEINTEGESPVVDLGHVDEAEIFGAGHEATTPVSDRLAFIFNVAEAEGVATRFILRYSAASVPENGLEIQLNEQAIGFAAAAPESWLDGIEVLLPAGLLRAGQTNRVSFVASYQAPGGWLIRAPELVVEPIPPCAPAACVEQAERLHAIGLRKFEAQALVSSNLYEAWSAFREADLFLVPLGGRTPLHERNEELEERTKKALDQRCSRLRFTVVRSVALGDEPAARRAVDEILRSFPGDGHRCRQAGRYLSELLDG